MRVRVSVRPAQALAVLLIVSSVDSFRLPPGYEGKSILGRADNACPTNANLTQCGQGLPSTFCCDLSVTSCMVIANGTGALCCPNQADGSPGDCQTMSPIDGGCDADAYNATLFPTSPIHLKIIPTSFTPCGNKDGVCCPPGFACTDGKCVTQDKSVASSPGSAATASVVTLASAHPTAPSKSTAQAQSTSSSNTDSTTANQFPPIAILVGLFPGIVAGALLTFVVMACVSRHRKHRRRHRRRHHRKVNDDGASDLGPIRAQVSDPIYHDDGTGRVDFLRRNNTLSGLRSSKDDSYGTPGRSPALSRVRSLFSRRSTQSPHGLGVGLETPRTPHRSPKREPSMESITIFSPPDMRTGGAGDRTTTYSDVLRAAGAYPHQAMPSAYMGSPGMVDPRSRGVDNGNLR